MTAHSDIHSEIEDIVDEFDLLGDWEERYKYLIDMGKALPDMPESDRTDANKVKGCVSQVWLVTEPGKDTLTFRADSDAHIVRGLAALLLRVYSGRSPADILSVDAREVLKRIGLSEHLSPQRSNGLTSMIGRIRAAAAPDVRSRISSPRAIDFRQPPQGEPDGGAAGTLAPAEAALHGGQALLADQGRLDDLRQLRAQRVQRLENTILCSDGAEGGVFRSPARTLTAARGCG